MLDGWFTQFTKEALTKVDAFIAEHPDYTRQGVEQPGQGATNRVVFARRGDDQVVFKVFCQAERKERECYALRHWRETGLVPELLADIDDTMIVMSHVPGVYLGQARQVDDTATWHSACRETGRAVGSLTRVPLSTAQRAAFESRFYDGLGTLEAYLGRILDLGASIQARDPDFQDQFWRDSLDFIQAQLAGILAQPRVLYHQDPANLHVQQGRFMGFFDLEMCRVGCAAMQLASAVGMLEGETAEWKPFREGWETATGRSLGPGDLQATLAANYLLHWREISRYLSYDGTPGSGYAWASPAAPIRYRRTIGAMSRMMGIKWRQ
jgi:Ser/Thr protein kinase RdoA (MazF antagonist)